MKNNNELEKNWAFATLDQIIAGDGVFTDGDWVESKDQDENGGVRLIQLADIGDGEYKDKSARFMNSETAEELRCTYIEQGDVLVARMPDPLGRACIFPGDKKKSVTVVDVCILRPATKNVDNKWLMYWINSPIFRNKIAALQSGTTRRRISRKNLASIKFPVPPSMLQVTIREKIEEHFSHIDAGVEELKQAKAKLQQYRQSVLKDAVTGKLTEQWRELNAGKLEKADKLLECLIEERRVNWEDEQLKIFEEKGKSPKNDKWKEKYKEPPRADTSVLPEIPDSWVWSTITQLGELNRGKSKHRPRNEPSLYDGEYPFVQTGDVRAADGVLTKYKKTYSEKGLSQSRLWPKGTLCITIAANIAETAILGLDACFPDSVVGFIPQNENVSVEYIEFFFRTAKEDLDRYAPATAQKNINLAILETVSVPFMSAAEQKELVLQVTEKLDASNRTEKTIDEKIRNSTSLKSSILAKAYAGELVPNDSSENAQELLDKIREEKVQQLENKPKNDKRKKKVTSERKPLLAILKKETKAITPEELMQKAGYSSNDIDMFYVKLADIAEQIEQLPIDSESLKGWPYEKKSNIKLKLKD